MTTTDGFGRSGPPNCAVPWEPITAAILAPAELPHNEYPTALTLPDGRRVLRFDRGKTGVVVEIEIVGELAKAIDGFLEGPVIYGTFVHTREGDRSDGIAAMFRRSCVGTKEKPADPQVADFSLRDLRAKGATEMYRTGIDVRLIQHLIGHRSVRTTEIYLKSLVPETVRPNEMPIAASAVVRGS